MFHSCSSYKGFQIPCILKKIQVQTLKKGTSKAPNLSETLHLKIDGMNNVSLSIWGPRPIPFRFAELVPSEPTQASRKVFS